MYLQFYCNQVDNPHSPEDRGWHENCGWDRSWSRSVGGNSEDHDWNWLGRLHCSMAPQHCLLQSTVYKSLNFILLCLPVRFIRLEWTWRSAGSGTKWWSMFLESRRGSWRLPRKKVNYHYADYKISSSNSASWHCRWDHGGCCHQHGDSRLRVKSWMSDWNAIIFT